jgi:Spy/CpxP family protein refolding chaperone
VKEIMMRSIRFALAKSAVLAVLAGATVCVSATAFASPDAPDAHGQHEGREGAHHGHHRGHEHAHLIKRALALPSLNNAQRAQIEALAQEAQANHATVSAARAKVLTTLAGQVDKGAIDRAALAPSLKDETDAMVAARLRERSIAERLHTILTAKQCEEVGGGKDFLRPAHPETEVRAHTERMVTHTIDRLEKKLPSTTPEQRAEIAARLRARAAH